MEAEDLLKWPMIGPIIAAFDVDRDTPRARRLRILGMTLLWTFVVVIVCLTFVAVYLLAKWGMSIFG